MKSVFFITALVSICFSSPANSFQLEGKHFILSRNVDIVWKATNDLPHGLWIYKVLPESFSMGIISNAMAIGHFTMKDLSHGSHPILKRQASDLFFQQK